MMEAILICLWFPCHWTYFVRDPPARKDRTSCETARWLATFSVEAFARKIMIDAQIFYFFVLAVF